MVFEAYKSKLCDVCTKLKKNIVSNWTFLLDGHDLEKVDLSVRTFFSFQVCFSGYHHYPLSKEQQTFGDKVLALK